MKQTGTLESFYPTSTTTPFPSQLFPQVHYPKTSSTKTSPSPTQRPKKPLTSYHNSSFSSNPTELNKTLQKILKNRKSFTPAPNSLPKPSKKKSLYQPKAQNERTSEGQYIQMKEKVRNELMLECDHHIIRSIKKNMRSDEYKVSGMYLDSTQLFNRLSARMENPGQPFQPYKVLKNNGTGKLVHKKSVACHKVLGQTASEWIHKHGKLSDSISLKSTASVIFDMLDPSNKGEITGRQFCEFLIDIGFPLEIFTVFTFVKAYKYAADIENIRLVMEDISNFCRADHRTNSMLVSLYCATGEVNTEKHSQIDIVKLFKVLKGWWEEIDVNREHLIHLNTVCVFLVTKGVGCDFNEAYKIVAKCAVDSFVDFAHFQLIFVKGFVKHQLVTIQYRFTPEDWANEDFSNAYKLCQLKKHLILAGILYPVPQISYEEGLAALAATQNYSKILNKPLHKVEYSEFCGIWKDITGEILGKTYAKANILEHPESLIESQAQRMNRFSIIGNTNTAFRGKQPWHHSFSPEVQLKEFAAVNKGELRFLRENKLFKQFCEIVNYEGSPISN